MLNENHPNYSLCFSSEKWKFTFSMGKIFFFLIVLSSTFLAKASPKSIEHLPENYIITTKLAGSFTISEFGKTAPIVISNDEFPGVIRIAGYVQEDLLKVTGEKPELLIGTVPSSGEFIIAGTLGKSTLIDQLVKSKKIDVSDIQGKWESTLTQVVDNPFPGVKKVLVIVGSDKCGTIFGLFSLSRGIGVSPWYWWADVPIPVQKTLYAKAGRNLSGEPKVKYRGIFLNDEEPALGRWAVEKFGGFNSQFYEKLFELMLRMKSNFVWPAMWWAAFNSDDPKNTQLADEMGIVIGTSHHEPMNRAHAEWKPYGGKEWDYEKKIKPGATANVLDRRY